MRSNIQKLSSKLMNEVTSAAPPQVEECEVRLDVPEVCCIGAPAAVPGSARTRDVVEALVDRKAIRSTFGLEGQATAEAWREWPWVSVNDVHLQLQRTTGGARRRAHRLQCRANRGGLPCVSSDHCAYSRRRPGDWYPCRCGFQIDPASTSAAAKHGPADLSAW